MKRSPSVTPSDEELLSAINGADADAAASAATTLGMRGDARAVDALRTLLHHAVPAARAAAATALGLIGSESVMPELREAMHDPDPTVAGAASLALQRLGDEGSVDGACDAMIAELHASDPERRALAARALGGLKRCDAVSALIGSLSDENALVRADAAGSLGWLGDASATSALAMVGFSDPDPFVRKVAMDAASRLVVPGTPV